jgi:2'-5' RNA ligase
MRLFIAFDLPKNVVKRLVDLQKQIGIDLAQIKFVEPENMHLTLKFLGEVEEGKVGKIIERLKSVKFKPFMTSISEIGVFPNEKFIRVVWIGLKPFDPIEDLHNRIDSALSDMFNKDEKFQAHVTLGRVKFIKDKKKFLSVLKALKMSDIVEPFVIDKFSLKKSTLTPKGPIYENIAVFS